MTVNQANLLILASAIYDEMLAMEALEDCVDLDAAAND